MHIEFYRFFFYESVNKYARGGERCIFAQNKSPSWLYQPVPVSHNNKCRWLCSSPFRSFFYCWPVFQGALCVSNQDMGVILADLCIELASATISTANTHYCTDSRRGSSSTISLKRHDLLPTRATNTSLKSFCFSTFIPSQDTYFYKEVMWDLKA